MAFWRSKFVVTIEIENLLLTLDFSPGRFGGFTTRRVVTRDVDEACRRAIELVRAELESIPSYRNTPDDPPIFRIDGVDEVRSFEGKSGPGNGFSFYPMDEETAGAEFPPQQ
jgi:hypothetical protein